jgi:hypothetical protein
MTYIDGMDDPAMMWAMLAERYNPKSQTTLLQLVRELMTAKKDDSIDMEHHLQRVQCLKRKVEEQGEKISDTIYTVLSSTASLIITTLQSAFLKRRTSSHSRLSSTESWKKIERFMDWRVVIARWRCGAIQGR